MAKNHRVSNDEALACAQFFAADHLPGEFLKSLGFQAMFDFYSIEKRLILPPRAKLYREGDASSEVYLLLSGNARISTKSKAGRSFLFRVAMPGEFLGLESVIVDMPHETTAEMVLPARLSSIRRLDFLDFLTHHPHASLAVMREMGIEYERACRRLRTMRLTTSIPGRLARLILEWSSHVHEEDRARTFHAPMTRHEIADSIGASPKSVSRAMGDLQKDGVIEVHGVLLTILDPGELEIRSLM